LLKLWEMLLGIKVWNMYEGISGPRITVWFSLMDVIRVAAFMPGREAKRNNIWNLAS
jgi:hypothetical protein